MSLSEECRGARCSACEDPVCTCAHHRAHRVVHNEIPLRNPIRDLEKQNPGKTDEMIVRLMSVLGHGLDNIKGSRQIAREIGMPDRWQVGALVNIARERGCLIGSLHSRGYWIIETQEEFELTKETLLVRIGGIRRTLESVSAAWDGEQSKRAMT